MALDETPALSPDEIRSATAVLEAVLAHWQPTGITTVQTLQDNFIRRNGVLTHDMSMKLSVAPSPSDLLLHAFPWIYRRVETPWSGEIVVDW